MLEPMTSSSPDVCSLCCNGQQPVAVLHMPYQCGTYKLGRTGQGRAIAAGKFMYPAASRAADNEVDLEALGHSQSRP
jgi:hypothetical protein